MSIKKADKEFSAYIRLRDAIETTGTQVIAKCITCGESGDIRYMDAGHWKGRGSKATRYDEHNVHAQCQKCNRWRDMSKIYREKIVEKYGEEEAQRIEKDFHKTKRFTKDELDSIIKLYRKKYRELLG